MSKQFRIPLEFPVTVIVTVTADSLDAAIDAIETVDASNAAVIPTDRSLWQPNFDDASIDYNLADKLNASTGDGSSVTNKSGG
jgi:hypothetical protein